MVSLSAGLALFAVAEQKRRDLRIIHHCDLLGTITAVGEERADILPCASADRCLRILTLYARRH